MKQKILKLRKEGKSYNQIKKILGCSKSTISYYCGKGQKEKNQKRTKKYRSKNSLLWKLDRWGRNKFILGVRNFRDRKKDRNGKLKADNRPKKHFNYKDVLEKFGINTVCYISGEKINLLEDKHYNFDHIIPVTKGGSNELDNLGIVHGEVNRMKYSKTNEELFDWCIKILKHNGFKIKDKNNKVV